MQWVLALAFCIAAGAATWGGLRDDEPGLRLTIHETMPFADPEDSNILGRRYWDVRPRFSVEPRCEGLRLSSGRQIRYNDRPVGGADDLATAGDAVLVSASVRCRNGLRARAEKLIELPTASCDAGPLRVFDMQGAATSYDWNHEAVFPLRPGHLVAPGSPVEISPGGWIELGAPDCNLLRVRFFEGENTVGGYERTGRGDWFSGRRVFARGDRHTGGFAVPGRPGQPNLAEIEPLGDRFSSYAVRSTARGVTVRVYLGAPVEVRGSEETAGVRARPGEQVNVYCSGPKRCAPEPPRLFQPNEPWVQEPARGLARLAPRFATVSARRLAASGGAPEQMLVAWSRTSRTRYGVVVDRQGVWIWERKAGWQRVYAHQAPFANTETSVGDVTSDGHPDVLISEAQGTGACGVRRLVAFAGGRTSELFARDFCEGDARILGGALRVRQAVGPCPYKEMSAHCRGGLLTTTLRWQGARLVAATKTVRCNLAHLDPARDCAPKRKLNTP